MLEYRWRIFEFEVGERDFWHQKMSVWLCLSVIIVQFVALNYSRCIEESHFGAVTFGKRVICHSCSKIWASSNRGRSAMVTLVNGADFSTGWSLFYWLFTLKHFVFLPFKKTWLTCWMTVLGVVQKFLGASSIRLPFAGCNMTVWIGIGNFNLSLFVSQR